MRWNLLSRTSLTSRATRTKRSNMSTSADRDALLFETSTTLALLSPTLSSDLLEPVVERSTSSATEGMTERMSRRNHADET
jgi:hypothetical protein